MNLDINFKTIIIIMEMFITKLMIDSVKETIEKITLFVVYVNIFLRLLLKRRKKINE